jgi:hypothetical protein
VSRIQLSNCSYSSLPKSAKSHFGCLGCLGVNFEIHLLPNCNCFLLQVFFTIVVYLGYYNFFVHSSGFCPLIFKVWCMEWNWMKHRFSFLSHNISSTHTAAMETIHNPHWVVDERGVDLGCFSSRTIVWSIAKTRSNHVPHRYLHGASGQLRPTEACCRRWHSKWREFQDAMILLWSEEIP